MPEKPNTIFKQRIKSKFSLRYSKIPGWIYIHLFIYLFIYFFINLCLLYYKGFQGAYIVSVRHIFITLKKLSFFGVGRNLLWTKSNALLTRNIAAAGFVNGRNITFAYVFVVLSEQRLLLI